MNGPEFWQRFIESQLLVAQIRHAKPSRLPLWLRRLLHPIRWYRYRRARLSALRGAQDVINAALASYESALRFFESLPALESED